VLLNKEADRTLLQWSWLFLGKLKSKKCVKKIEFMLYWHIDLHIYFNILLLSFRNYTCICKNNDIE